VHDEINGREKGKGDTAEGSPEEGKTIGVQGRREIALTTNK